MSQRATWNARGMRASIGPLGLCVLGLVGCISDDPVPVDDGSDADRFATGAPMYVEPTEPGFLSVEPPVVYVTVGQGFLLTAALHDSRGVAQPTPTITWSSSHEDVVTVDGAGSLTGVGLGIAEVIATDTAGRVASAAVYVVEVVPEGAVSFGCDPPFRALVVGDTAPLGTRTWSAVPAGATLLRYEISNPEVVAIDDTENVTARAPGIARITAVRAADGVALEGECVVAVAPAGPTMSGEAGEEVGGCWFVRPPIWYSQPGLARQLRVGVFRYTWTAAGLAGFRVTQESPEAVRLGVEGVVGIGGDGLLASLAAGRAEVSGTVEGVACDFFRTSVAIDVAGSWVASCGNGDTGAVTFSAFPAVVVTAHVSESGTAAPTQYVAQVRARGTSCFSNADDGFSCSEPSEVIASVSGSSNNHLCSAGSPCPWIIVRECGAARHGGASQIMGADSFEANGCTYTRGEAPTGSACAGLSCDAPAAHGECRDDDFRSLCGEYADFRAPAYGIPACADAAVVPCICEGLAAYRACQVADFGDGRIDCDRGTSCCSIERSTCWAGITDAYVACVERAAPGCVALIECERAYRTYLAESSCVPPSSC